MISPFRGIHSKDKELIGFVKNIFGYSPDNVALYKLALCHRSNSTEEINGYKINNERLEFLGDAILGAIVAEYLFKKFPQKDEGFLTEMRSRIVSRESLNKLSKKLGVNGLIKMSNNSVYRSICGDTFEALVGALFLDKGYRITQKVIVYRIIKFHFDIEQIESNDRNFKSQLIEWAQRSKKQVEFVVVDELGNGFHKQYVVNVMIDKVCSGTGYDYSIKKAEQDAAEKCLANMVATS